jgi:hypothetical protein
MTQRCRTMMANVGSLHGGQGERMKSRLTCWLELISSV